MSTLYDVAIETPTSHKRGTLRFSLEGESVNALLEINNYDPVALVGSGDGKEFHLEGNADFPTMSQISYSGEGTIWGNTLSIKLETSAGKAEIFGTRLGDAAGQATSSHDYMMRGADGNFDRDDQTMYSGLFSDGG